MFKLDNLKLYFFSVWTQNCMIRELSSVLTYMASNLCTGLSSSSSTRRTIATTPKLYYTRITIMTTSFLTHLSTCPLYTHLWQCCSNFWFVLDMVRSQYNNIYKITIATADCETFLFLSKKTHITMTKCNMGLCKKVYIKSSVQNSLYMNIRRLKGTSESCWW